MAKKSFEDIKPWDGTNGTGAQARAILKANFAKVNDALDEIAADIKTKVGSGIQKGMSMFWDLNLGPIPDGFVLADGNGGVKVNGVTILDLRDRFILGYNSAKEPMPYEAEPGVENYGKVGNVGGSNSLTLTQDQLPPTYFYIFANSNDPESPLVDNENRPPVWSTNHKKGNQDYDIYGKSLVEASLGKTNTIGKGDSIDIRPLYVVVCVITKVTDDAAGGGNGLSAYEIAVANGFVGTEAEWLASLHGPSGDDGLSAYEIAVANGFIGTEAQWLASLYGSDGEDGLSAYEIAMANGFVGTEAQWLASLYGSDGLSAYQIALANGFVGTEAQWLASLHGSSTETAQYVLSGLDAKIELGVKASHTILEAHNFTTDKIYLEATTAPTDYDIIVDVKKNGTSIFSTKPKISVGNLHKTINPVLVTSPTVFSAGDIRTITVDQVGGTETGKNLVLSILMNKTI